MQVSLKQLLASQLFIVLFSAVIAFIPSFAILAIIAYFALIAVLQIKGFSGAGIPSEVASSKVVLREKGVDKLAMGDEKLVEESLQVMKANILPVLASFPVILAIYYTLPHAVLPIAESCFGSMLGRFIAWLVVFEVIFGVSSLTRKLLASRLGRAYPLLIAREYIVYEKGVVLALGGRKVTLRFPLDASRYELQVDYRRGFVEIVDKRSRVRYRVYSRRVEQLYNLLRSKLEAHR